MNEDILTTRGGVETRSAVSNPYTLTVNQNYSVSASIASDYVLSGNVTILVAEHRRSGSTGGSGYGTTRHEYGTLIGSYSDGNGIAFRRYGAVLDPGPYDADLVLYTNVLNMRHSIIFGTSQFTSGRTAYITCNGITVAIPAGQIVENQSMSDLIRNNNMKTLTFFIGIK